MNPPTPSRSIDPRRIEVIDDATAAMYRAMTPAERIALGLGMHEFARDMAEAGIRSAHPDWTPEQVHREAVARTARAAG